MEIETAAAPTTTGARRIEVGALRTLSTAWIVALVITLGGQLFQMYVTFSIRSHGTDYTHILALLRGVGAARLVARLVITGVVAHALFRVARSHPHSRLASMMTGAAALYLIAAVDALALQFAALGTSLIDVAEKLLTWGNFAALLAAYSANVLATLSLDSLGAAGGRPLPSGAKTAMYFLVGWGVLTSFLFDVLGTFRSGRGLESVWWVLSIVEGAAILGLLAWFARSAASALARVPEGALPPLQPVVATERESAARDLVIGGALLAVGLGVTFATWSAAAESGGRYVIAWGAIVFGAIRLVRGIARVAR